MRTALRRIAKLEERFGAKNGGLQHLLVLRRADRAVALSTDECVEVLRNCGFLSGRGFGMLNFLKMPAALNAAQTEQYLREHGAEICGAHRLGAEPR